MTNSVDQSVERQLRQIVTLCDDAPAPRTGVTVENVGSKLDEFDEILSRIRGLADNCLLVTDDRSHFHMAGTTEGLDVDECARCGKDIRNPIHARQSP